MLSVRSKNLSVGIRIYTCTWDHAINRLVQGDKKEQNIGQNAKMTRRRELCELQYIHILKGTINFNKMKKKFNESFECYLGLMDWDFFEWNSEPLYTLK